MEPTATRVWKKLSPEERLAAARHFFEEPAPDLLASATALVVKARHVRPQVARSLPDEEKARAVAAMREPGEPLAAALLVALHLGERRAILAAFLDALALPHDNGILAEEAQDAPPLAREPARRAVAALAAAFPRPQVETYLNTLWLQDPERWDALEDSASWLDEPAR